MLSELRVPGSASSGGHLVPVHGKQIHKKICEFFKEEA